MRTLNPTTRTWRFAALAALLLCAQMMALTHALAHEAEAHTETCASCVLGTSVKHAVAAAEFTCPALPAVAFHDETPVLPVFVVDTLHAEARAPPVNS